MECSYAIEDLGESLYNIYCCTVQNDLSIKSREVSVITSVNRTHDSGQINDNVHGFLVRNKSINYFPKGLEKIFRNLKGIAIQQCHLKQVTQADLQVFSKLVTFTCKIMTLKYLKKGYLTLTQN